MDLNKELLTLEKLAAESLEREHKRNEGVLVHNIISTITNSSNTAIQTFITTLYKLSRTNYNSKSITNEICSFSDIGHFEAEGAKYWSGASRTLIKTTLQDRIEEQRNNKTFIKRIEGAYEVDHNHLIDITIRFLDLLNHYHKPQVHLDVIIQDLNTAEGIIYIRNLISVDRLKYIAEENEQLIEGLKIGVKEWYQKSKFDFLETPNGYHQHTYVKFYRYILEEDQFEILRELFLQGIEEKTIELKDRAWKMRPEEIVSEAEYLRKKVEEIEDWK